MVRSYGKRIVDFLLVVVELFSLAITAEALQAIQSFDIINITVFNILQLYIHPAD